MTNFSASSGTFELEKFSAARNLSKGQIVLNGVRDDPDLTKMITTIMREIASRIHRENWH